MDAVVLGACGAVGREVSSGLVAGGAYDRVLLADLDLAGLRLSGRELHGSVSIRRVDAADATALRRALRGAGVVVNCTSYRFGVQALQAAIAEGVDYLDLGGLYNTPRQLALDARARRAGIRAVIGCGATPGLSNVLARRAADLLDRVEEVHISFASHRDLAPSRGLLDTLLDEFRPGIPRFTWREGRLQEVAPFEGAMRVRFGAPLGNQDVYYVPHSETYTLPRFLGNGLREVAVRGTWRPSDMEMLAALARLGLTSDRPIRIEGAQVRPLDVVREVILSRPPRDPSAAWAFYLDVRVVGERHGRRAVIRQAATHPLDWGPAATGRMTAVPAVAGAEALARGEVAGPGVVPPEAAFDPDRFIRAIRRSGIKVTMRQGR